MALRPWGPARPPLPRPSAPRAPQRHAASPPPPAPSPRRAAAAPGLRPASPRRRPPRPPGPQAERGDTARPPVAVDVPPAVEVPAVCSIPSRAETPRGALFLPPDTRRGIRAKGRREEPRVTSLQLRHAGHHRHFMCFNNAPTPNKRVDAKLLPRPKRVPSPPCKESGPTGWTIEAVIHVASERTWALSQPLDSVPVPPATGPRNPLPTSTARNRCSVKGMDDSPICLSLPDIK